MRLFNLRCCFVLLTLFIGAEVHASDLRYNLKWDVAITATALAGWVGMEAAENKIAPSSCRWCGVNSFDSWGHDNLKWSNRTAANRLSAVSAYIISPMVALGMDAIAANHDDELTNFGVDALLIGESAAVSALFTDILKISVGRQRPDAHYGEVSLNNSSNTSFTSGHTNLAFALAVSSGTIATMREYKLAPYIWGAGLALASANGYFRLAADRHYLTDVIGGAVIGSAFGFSVPYFFHRQKESKLHGMILSPAHFSGGATGLSLSGFM